MKFSSIFMITFICTLYISERSTAENDDSFDSKPADEIPNAIIEQEFERNKVERDNDIQFPPMNETSSSIGERKFEIDMSDMLRAKKGNKKSPPRNCYDIKKQRKPSGTYMIFPCDDTPTKAVQVYCDMDTDRRGGWTVIQRRDNYAVQQDFYLTWDQYILGFGDVSQDFWLGNENIHCLTKQSYNEIRFDLKSFNGSTAYANYDFFYVAGADELYKMEVGDYTGTAGDSFTNHNGMTFSTWDAENDKDSSRNCAEVCKGAWWYNKCYQSNLNGMYNGTGIEDIVWYTFTGWGVSLEATEMKIRPKYD